MDDPPDGNPARANPHEQGIGATGLIRLTCGHYLSPIGARRRSAVASLVETVYTAGMRLPRHSHEFPYLVLMVDGTLRERTCGKTHDLTGGSVVFNEAGEVHENEVLNGRARCLNVELRAPFMERLASAGLRPRESVLYGHARGAIGAVGRLYAAVIDPGPEVEIEEALIGLFEALGPRGAQNRILDQRGVGRAVALIHDSFPDRPRLGTLAAEVGVHEAHLCRSFRASMGCTIGEYIRQLRTAKALGAVTGGDRPLADAALGAGFADQSHMTRAFSSEFGRSPGRLRRAAAGRKVPSRFP